MSRTIYTELAEEYARHSETGPPNALYDRPEILRLAGPLAGRDVLELGCAAGHLTRLMLDEGAAVTAVDGSEAMVATARARAPEATVHLADLGDPGALRMVPGGGVDVVTASLVLHYLPEWRPLMAEISRVLRPDGVLVLSVHHPITGWLLAGREDYHRVEEVEEQWNVAGVPTVGRMWRRPVSGVFAPLLEAGLVVDAVTEPLLDEEQARTITDERMRWTLTTQPVFLFVRAGRPAHHGAVGQDSRNT
ncbi:class I SAM-dependent DNA methyltransferase [Nocardioides sp. GCM10027113]|uniref:class I SAM-dependent DNA methyltransferase n=1 Tax=unclassified Nocardioides TaxID=2615069 RepID=UPI003616398C